MGTESELRRKLLASQERERTWTWVIRCQGVLVCMLSLLLIAYHIGWIYTLGPIVVVGLIGFIVCLVLAIRHLFASFMT